MAESGDSGEPDEPNESAEASEPDEQGESDDSGEPGGSGGLDVEARNRVSHFVPGNHFYGKPERLRADDFVRCGGAYHGKAALQFASRRRGGESYQSAKGLSLLGRIVSHRAHRGAMFPATGYRAFAGNYVCFGNVQHEVALL